MAAETRGTDPRTVPLAPRTGRADDLLPVEGDLPPGLRACFLQAETHPAADVARDAGHVSDAILVGPHLLSGIALGAGRARWLRCASPVARSRPLGPVPSLAPVLWPGRREGPGTVAFARPVRDPVDGRWHTVATYPGLAHAEHLITAPDGTVVQAEPFALDGAPLMHAVGLTRRYLVVLDLPVVHSRAAALVGARPPYVWRDDRPARVGFLPRSGGAPTWIHIDPCYVFDVVHAYDDGTRVVLDVVGRRRAFAGDDADGAADGPRTWLRRWRFDPAAGVVETRRLADSVTGAAVVPGVRAGAHPRLVAVEPGGTVAVHDPARGTVCRNPLGDGWRAGGPVFVPGTANVGWILAVALHTASGRCELRVLDVHGRRVAAVRLPVRLGMGRAVRPGAVGAPETLSPYLHPCALSGQFFHM